MPRYDFKCGECDHVVENKILRITHSDSDIPKHCGQTMGYHITQAPSVVWVDPIIEPFRAIATKDRPVISSTRENREYMARNGLIDANELGPPPTKAEQMETVAKMQESISAITPDAETSAIMESQGLLDPST